MERRSIGGKPIIFCQMPVIEKWAEEPACEILLNGLLTYLLQDEAEPAQQRTRSSLGVGLYGDPENPVLLGIAEYVLGKEREKAAETIDNANPFSGSGTVIMDASSKGIEAILGSQARFSKDLLSFVDQGGVALIIALEPDTTEYFREILGEDTEMVRYRGEAISLPEPDSPLLWGFAASDWEILAASEQRNAESDVSDSERYSVDFAGKGNAKVLVKPGLLAIINKGEGKALILQYKQPATQPPALRILFGQLPANLGVRVNVRPEEREDSRSRW
jgi:hypothetical protein